MDINASQLVCRKTFREGDVIFREQDKSQEAFRIISGLVEISIAGPDCKPLVLAKLGAGDIFGEMGMIDEKPRSATALALEKTELEILTPEEFNHRIIHDPATLVPFLASFFERLRTANDRLRMEIYLRKKLPPGTVPSIDHPWCPMPEKPAEAVFNSLKITAVSHEAKANAPLGEYVIRKFPFRIGRTPERKEFDVFAINDYTIKDEKPFRISRNHLAIEKEGNHLFVRDRGSVTGTIINDTPIGLGRESLAAQIHPGENILILGDQHSPYKFKLEPK